MLKSKTEKQFYDVGGKMKIPFRRIWDILKDVLFTKRCKYCGDVADIRYELCDECSKNLPRITGDICYLCGAEKSVCKCKGKKHFYVAVCGPFYYDGGVRKSILNLKFRGRTYIAANLAEDMAECFKTRYAGYRFDKCTYVPCTKKTVKIRGFNQAKILAENFSEKTGIPCEELLLKTYETKVQHNLPEMERSGNVLGTFDPTDVDIENMRILLIDDVKTTGSTLDECAKTLLINGAAEVFCLVAAVR